ncbi:hypothetical protein MRX96_048394 [Rhipicephalus microplus]
MMTTSDLKPICSFSNVSTPTWESVNFGEILWNFGAMGAFGDHLQHFQLQDEILHARRANSKQAVWKALLLGYAVVIIAARLTAPSLRRRHVIPAALLLAIMIPLTNPYLQSLSSLTLFMAIVVAILEVTCVVRLLSLKPFGPVAAAIGALLRLMTALAPLFFKHSVLVNSGSQLTSLGLLAPAAFLLLFVYVMDTSEFSEGKNCSNATVDDVTCPSTVTFTPSSTVEADVKQTPGAPFGERRRNHCLNVTRMLQREERFLRRSMRLRRTVDRFNPSAHIKLV